jgi:hypothetical protein
MIAGKLRTYVATEYSASFHVSRCQYYLTVSVVTNDARRTSEIKSRNRYGICSIQQKEVSFSPA